MPDISVRDTSCQLVMLSKICGVRNRGSLMISGDKSLALNRGTDRYYGKCDLSFCIVSFKSFSLMYIEIQETIPYQQIESSCTNLSKWMNV